MSAVLKITNAFKVGPEEKVDEVDKLTGEKRKVIKRKRWIKEFDMKQWRTREEDTAGAIDKGLTAQDMYQPPILNVQ